MIKKVNILIIKWFPILMNIFILCTGIEVLFNIDLKTQYAYTTLGYSFVILCLLFGLSLEKKFCLWHRLLLYNMFFTLVLETINLFGVIIPCSIYLLTIVTALTLVTSIILLNKVWLKTTYIKMKRMCANFLH